MQPLQSYKLAQQIYCKMLRSNLWQDCLCAARSQLLQGAPTLLHSIALPPQCCFKRRLVSWTALFLTSPAPV